MKLYSWYEPGDGPLSLFVMAKDRAAAVEAMNAKIARVTGEDQYEMERYDYPLGPGDIYEAGEGIVLIIGND